MIEEDRGYRELASAVIVQAIHDLSNKKERSLALNWLTSADYKTERSFWLRWLNIRDDEFQKLLHSRKWKLYARGRGDTWEPKSFQNKIYEKII